MLSPTCSSFMFDFHIWIFLQWIWCRMFLCLAMLLLLHGRMVAYMQDPCSGFHYRIVRTCRMLWPLAIIAHLGVFITILELRSIQLTYAWGRGRHLGTTCQDHSDTCVKFEIFWWVMKWSRFENPIRTRAWVDTKFLYSSWHHLGMPFPKSYFDYFSTNFYLFS